MKTENKHIENEVKRTLESLDNIQKASPRPFLYTRIMARLEGTEMNKSVSRELKPVYQRIFVGALVLLAVINIFTASLFLGNNSDSGTEISQEESYFEGYYPTLTTIDNLEQYTTE